MTSLKSFAKETVIYGLSHILPRILHYIVMTVYLTYRFNDQTSDYGIYSDLYAYSSIILVLMIFRMDTAYFRFGSKYANKDLVFSTVLVPIFITVGILGGGLFVFSGGLAELMGYAEQTHYVRWFAIILSLDALSATVFARFRLANRPWRFLFYRVANVIITILAVLFFLEFLPWFNPSGYDMFMEKLSIKNELDFVFLSNLIASVSVFALLLPEYFKAKFAISRELLREVLQYSWPLVIVAVAATLNQSLTIILQKYWLPGTWEENLNWVGIFGAAAKLAILLNLFTTAFNYAAEPFFFNNAAKENKKEIYGDVTLMYAIFSSIVAMGTYLFIDLFVLLIGSNYRPGIVVVPILLIAYILLGIYYMVAIWYKLADKTLFGALVSFVGVIITIVASFILLPTLGIVGAGWTALICYFTMLILCYKLGQRYYPIEYPVKRVLIILLWTGLIIFISFVLRAKLSLSLWNNVMINTLLFASGAWVIFKKEKTFIINSFAKNK